jgi:O-antigen/teichoic acid export membrane protein
VSRLRCYYRQANIPPLVRTLLGGVTAALSGVFASTVLSALAQILIARQLGTLAFGEYATITATLGIIASLLGIGLDTWILAEGSRNPASLTRDVWYVLLLKAFGACVLLILLGIAWSNRIVNTLAFVVGIVGVILDSFAQTGYSALRAVRRNRQVAIFQSLTPLLLLLALWATGRSTLGLLPLLAIQAVTSGVITVFMLIRIWRVYGSPKGHTFDFRYVIGGAWLFVAADVLASIYSLFAIAMLGTLAGPTEAGLLRPALTTINYTFMVSGLLFSVGLPMLNTPGISRAGFSGLVRTMSIVALVVGLGSTIGLWLFGDLALHTLYGDAYAAGLPLLRTVAIIPLIKAGTFVCAAILVAYGRMVLRIILQLAVAALSVAGALLIIPRFGAAGTAWLYVGIEAVLFTLYLGAVLLAARQRA